VFKRNLDLTFFKYQRYHWGNLC